MRVSEDLSALEQDVMRVMTEFEEAFEGRDELREEVEQIKSKLTILTNSLNKHKSDLQDLLHEKEKLVSCVSTFPGPPITNWDHLWTPHTDPLGHIKNTMTVTISV